ncbi:LysR substrate-binding domain-containing protein [Salidesulfovibrio onnuriiensis]|uniref:LysR substrate-binding domain-containing protein n=1 Tax=Salidesulfovibrio onnuriiensis TaxID=2583823 RepID=UPI00165079E7|nr:LysR substrate-binding domain-containing protein [Salidesulfovibrio onnuriiensis]
MLDDKAPFNLPLESLRTFAAAADTGNFTRAAEQVHRTQAAVSMQMAKLENEVGCRLFERMGRGVALTFEGETLLKYARQILDLHDEALAAMTAPDMEGRVRLGAPEDYATCFLPGILAAFHAAYPRVLVEVFCGTSRSLAKRYARGEFDLAILNHPAPPEDAAAQVIHHEPIVWITSGEHGVHEQRPLPLAVFHEGCPYRRWAIEGCTERNIEHRICFVSPSLTGVLSAVRAGLAVAPVGRSTAGQGLRILGEQDGFPALPSTTVCLHQWVDRQHGIVNGLANFIMNRMG